MLGIAVKIIGFGLILWAVHMGRVGESKINFPSKDWFIVMALVVVGVFMNDYIYFLVQ